MPCRSTVTVDLNIVSSLGHKPWTISKCLRDWTSPPPLVESFLSMGPNLLRIPEDGLASGILLDEIQGPAEVGNLAIGGKYFRV